MIAPPAVRLPDWARKGSPLARGARGVRAFDTRAQALGFPTVHSGVFVRSSYGAEEVYREGGRR